MFKILLIASIAVAYVAAGSNPIDAQAETLKYVNDNQGDGRYKYIYETSNGIAAQEVGLGGEQANGDFAYYSPEGELIQLSYVANENGFQPQGQHLPTPPPIPYQILRSLEYIRTHPSQESQEFRQPAQKSFNNNAFRGRNF